MIYSFFSIIEVFIDVLLYWIPIYYPFKVAFLLLVMMPQIRSAKFLYDIDAESKDVVAVEATGAAKEAASAVASSLINISQMMR